MKGFLFVTLLLSGAVFGKSEMKVETFWATFCSGDISKASKLIKNDDEEFIKPKVKVKNYCYVISPLPKPEVEQNFDPNINNDQLFFVIRSKNNLVKGEYVVTVQGSISSQYFPEGGEFEDACKTTNFKTHKVKNVTKIRVKSPQKVLQLDVGTHSFSYGRVKSGDVMIDVKGPEGFHKQGGAYFPSLALCD